MSVRVMADVWDFGPLDPVDRFVLLALANFSNDDGANCFPKIVRIAKMVCQCERTVVRSLSRMELEGWVSIQRGTGRGNPSQYTINILKLKGDYATPFLDKRVTLTTEKGDSDDIAIRKNHHEPSLFSPDVSGGNENGNSKKKETDPRHTPCRERIFAFYQAVNEKDPPWGPGDAKQLSDLLKQTPKLTVEEFDQWLANYSESEGLNFANRPAQFLPRLVSFANGPLSKYGRPING